MLKITPKKDWSKVLININLIHVLVIVALSHFIYWLIIKKYLFLHILHITWRRFAFMDQPWYACNDKIDYFILTCWHIIS
jgi:hypothetical protein